MIRSLALYGRSYNVRSLALYGRSYNACSLALYGRFYRLNDTVTSNFSGQFSKRIFC